MNETSCPVCCVCGTPAESIQRLAIGMLKQVGCQPKAYCLRCWAERFPEIAARQAKSKNKKAEVVEEKRPRGKQAIDLI